MKRLEGRATCMFKNSGNIVNVSIHYWGDKEDYMITSGRLNFGDIFLGGLRVRIRDGVVFGSFGTEKEEQVREVEIKGDTLRKLCYLGVWGKAKEFEREFLKVLGMEGRTLKLKGSGSFSFVLKEKGSIVLHAQGNLEEGVAVPKSMTFNMAPIEGDNVLFFGNFNWKDGKWQPSGVEHIKRMWNIDGADYESVESVDVDFQNRLDPLFEAILERDMEKISKVYGNLFKNLQIVRTDKWFKASLRRGIERKQVSLEKSGELIVWKVEKDRNSLMGYKDETGQRLAELLSELGDNPDREKIEETFRLCDGLFVERKMRRR